MAPCSVFLCKDKHSRPPPPLAALRLVLWYAASLIKWNTSVERRLRSEVSGS